MKSPSKTVLLKMPWDKIWEKKGEAIREFNPVKIIGFDSSITVIPNEFVDSIICSVKSHLELTSSDYLLEIGCGVGMLLIPLSKSVRTVSGTDLSRSFIKRFSEEYPTFSLHVSEASKLPFKNNSFNKILIHSVFHYFPSLDYAKKSILEALRVSTRDGLILIMDIPDIKKKEECLKFYEKVQPEKYSNKDLQHIFYAKDFFEDICKENKVYCKTFDQNIHGYLNSPFRFNVLIKRNSSHT